MVHTLETRMEKTPRILLGILFVFVVIAIFPLTPEPASDIKTLLYQLFAFILLVVWLMSSRGLRGSFQRPNSLTVVLTAFLALNLLATLVSLDPRYSLFREFSKLASLFVIFLVATAIFQSEKHVWNFVAVACAAAALASLYGYLQTAGLDPFPWGNDKGTLHSAPATFGNPNYASHALAPILVLAAGLAFQRKRHWALIPIALITAHLFITGTRSSFAALIAAAALVLVALLIARARTSPTRGILLTFSLLLVLAAGAITAVGIYTNATSGRIYPYGGGVAIASRYHSFFGACRLVQEKPFLGHGPGMYRVVNVKHWTPFEKQIFKEKNEMNFHVHNEPLEIAVDAGIPAAVAYMAVLFLGVCCGLWLWYSPGTPALRSLGLTLAAFYVCFFVDGLFGFNFHVPVSSLLLFISLGATVGILKKRSAAAGGPDRVRRPVHWAAAVLIVVWAGGFAALAVRDFTAQFLHQRGRGAYDQEYFAAAADCYQKAATLAPYDWNHWHWVGLSEKRLGNETSAIGAFQQALRLNPFQYHTYLALAEALLRSASTSLDSTSLHEAESAAGKAIQIDGLLPEPHEILGQAKLLEAQTLSGESAVAALQEANDQFRQALQAQTKQKYRIYRMLATVRLALEDMPGAQKALVDSIEEKPDELATWQLFLRVSEKTGQYRPLLASLERHYPALEKAEASDSLLIALSMLNSTVLLDGFNDQAAAAQVMLRLAKNHPEEIAVWPQLRAFAKVTGQKNILRKALLSLNDQDKKSAGLPPVLHSVATAFAGEAEGISAAAAEFVQALQQKQAVETNPETIGKEFAWAAGVLTEQTEQTDLPPEKEADIYFKLGLAYGAWNDFATAAALLDRAFPHLPQEQAVLCLVRKASALAVTGKMNAAIEALEEARTMAPNDFDVRFALADTLSKAGKPERAETEYRGILNNFALTEKGVQLIERKLQELRLDNKTE